MAEHNRALSIVGASRVNGEREADDFYPTPAWVVERLLDREVFEGEIWEPACGDGAISEVLKRRGYQVHSTDLVGRGYGDGLLDFLNNADLTVSPRTTDNVITNPPYSLALDFVLQAKARARRKIALFLKTVWLESAERYEMFQDRAFPLKTMYQFCSRVTLYKGGHEKPKNSGTISYAWYVWQRGYIGKPMIEWIP